MSISFRNERKVFLVRYVECKLLAEDQIIGLKLLFVLVFHFLECVEFFWNFHWQQSSASFGFCPKVPWKSEAFTKGDRIVGIHHTSEKCSTETSPHAPLNDAYLNILLSEFSVFSYSMFLRSQYFSKTQFFN